MKAVEHDYPGRGHRVIEQRFEHSSNRLRPFVQNRQIRLVDNQPVALSPGDLTQNAQVPHSRRHCVIVNYLDDVWIYDLDSTQGVFVDGKRIDRKAYLEGVHVLKLGQTELTLCSKLELLV
jgi:hypothetical protein